MGPLGHDVDMVLETPAAIISCKHDCIFAYINVVSFILIFKPKK